MALTRKFLSALGIEADKVDEIINAHAETVNGLKEEAEKYKAYKEDAEKLPEVQKELDDLKKAGGDWQKKYEDEHKAFEDFRKDVETKEKETNIRAAYKALLKAQNVNEKHMDAIMRVTDFSGMKLKEDGTLDGADKLNESIKKDWDDFIVKSEKKGAEVETPPGDEGKQSRKPGRAAEIANRYHEGMYGAIEAKKE